MPPSRLQMNFGHTAPKDFWNPKYYITCRIILKAGDDGDCKLGLSGLSLLPSTCRNTFLFNFSRKDDVWVTAFNFREEEREDYLDVRKSWFPSKKKRIPAPAIQQPKKTVVVRDKLFINQIKCCGDVLHRTLGVPIFFERVLNTSAEMIAPAFPAAADMPWAEARKRVGKTEQIAR